MTPNKLQPGDGIRIIAPSRSMSILSDEVKSIANRKLSAFGFKVTFGRHVDEVDITVSPSIESRIEDLHDAFRDKNVKGILTVIGGFNCNQLLDYIDWDLIKNNPKVFCGYSDITALNNAIYAKTGLVTYLGPHYSTFGKKYDNEYTEKYFKKCLMQNEPFEILSSKRWDDRRWYSDQEDRTSFENAGMYVINEGEAEGTIIGGNLCTLGLLRGTQYMPDFADSILFIEDDDYAGTPVEFDRNLQALIHQPGFNKVRGIVIGRFQIVSKSSKEDLIHIIKTKRELNNIPVIANADFGHTDPKITFPIGGKAIINAINAPQIKIIEC